MSAEPSGVRERILDAALELMGRQGASATSMRRLATESGVQVAAIYHYFASKGDIYDAQLSVALVDYLRPELKFDGLDALITQMDADCVTARESLAHV